MWSTDRPRFSGKVIGDRGELRLHPLNPFQWFIVRSADGKRVERFPSRTTYAYQLDAFAAAVLRGEPVKTTAAEAVENMTVIDAIYRAAGLSVRQPA
jgi:predicted dehydrogenase